MSSAWHSLRTFCQPQPTPSDTEPTPSWACTVILYVHQNMASSYLLGVHTVGLLHQPVEYVLVGLLLLQLARGELLAQGTVVRYAGKAEDLGMMAW